MKEISGLARYLIAVGSAAWVIVVALVLLAALKRRRRDTLAEHLPPETGGGMVWVQLGGLIIPVLVLAVTFVLSERLLDRLPTTALAAVPKTRSNPSMVTDTATAIVVTGHQWWWQVRYGDFATANELHIPVGKPVRIVVRSDDVNHSFWVPALAPKKDLIPGRDNVLVLEADQPGTYRGECSEFCGQEHARMAFTVIAEPPDQYGAWVAREREAAPTPTDTLASRGRAAFLANACAFCHAVRGTTAHGVVAPDLTHLASRPTLAAGTLPNTRQNLEGWIMDAPSIKPGTQMPAFRQLDAPTLRAVVAYLETLR